MTAVANPHRRLAPRTSAHPCALSVENCLSTTPKSTLISPDRTAPVHPSARCHHHRRKNRTIGSFTGIPKHYSISIIPIRITATAAPAASFLPPNRKPLGLNSEAHSKLVAEAFPMLANGDSTGIQTTVIRDMQTNVWCEVSLV
jgi:hypothetical protein